MPTMAKDYSSIAQALAKPAESPNHPSQDGETTPSPIRRISSHVGRRRATPSPFRQNGNYVQKAVHLVRWGITKALSTYKGMNILQRIGAAIAVCILATFGILVLLYGHQIFGWLAPVAKRWHDVYFGWVLLWALIFVSAFPPMVGYSTLVTTCGFVYGAFPGWAIASTAAVCGSVGAFVASRTILARYVNRLVGEDTRFKALALTLKHDGIKTLCMIRLCPLPYSLSNGALSTIPTITPINFGLATAASMPKLLIHCFVGSRLALLAEDGGKMDTTTQIINYASIAGGITLGAVLGVVIYRRTVARARELEAEEDGQLARSTDTERLANPDDFADDDDVEDDDDDGPASMMGDDDISLWDSGTLPRRDGYRDEETDEEAADGGNGVVKKTNGKATVME